jgi:hypothetical protein
MSNDYFKAQGWFKNYATSSEDSRGLFQELVKEDEEAFRLASAETDRIKAMMNEKYGPGTIKYGSEIKQPEIKTPQAAFEFSQRNPAAEGGRMLNPVQMGEDRGDRTGFRKPIYVPTKKSYVVNDRTNNLIEDFKIEDYGSKSKAKKAADALDKKITAENKQRQIKISEKNRADFSNKRIDFKKSINTWTQNWMDNNIGNYDLQDADTFIKDMKEAFKDFNIEAPTKNTAASIEGFPNIGTDAKGGKAVFTPYGIDSIKKPGKSRGTTSYYDSFFRRAFLTNKIQTDEVLKRRISSYLDYATINKPGGSVALDKLKLKYADTLNNLDDVMYVLSDDTQVVNLAKKNLLSNIFPQYNKFREKKNASAISRKINIAKIEKTLGPKKLKELLNGGTSINKFLVDEGKTLKEFFPSMKELPLDLRYSIDHNIGISELAKLNKSDMEKGLNSLIGMSNKRNTDLGWKGYSVIKKNLINKIQQGKNVSGNIDKLNEITEKAYPEELKGKKAYNLVNGKLTFTEDFTFRTNPEERFKSYFEEINKTKKGKAAIKKDFGSLKNIDYIDGKGVTTLSSGFNTDLLMKDPLVQKLLNSKSGKAIAQSLRGTAGAVGKVFGGADIILGIVDYENNISKGQKPNEALQNAFQAMSINLYKGGDRARTEEVKKFFVKNGGDGKIFDQVTSLNTKDQEINDLIYNNKKTADTFVRYAKEDRGILTQDLEKSRADYKVLKKNLNEEIKNKIEERDGMVESYKTNLRVSEAGAPIQIGNQDFFSKPFKDTRRATMDKIESENKNAYDMQKRQVNYLSGNIGNYLQNNIFTLDPVEKAKQQKLINEMDERELYKFNLQRGMDPDNPIRIEDILRYKQTSPDLMGVNTTKYVNYDDRKAEGGIIGLRSKYEYKK